MRQLARTLLILGGVGACERAQPVVDERGAPAVGNIGQSGAGASVPLVDREGAPAVGNIGQSGAPPQRADDHRERRERRVQRAQRAAARANANVTTANATASNVAAIPRPEIPPAVPPRHTNPTLSVEVSPQPQVALRERPLVDRRERPAVGNIIGKCGTAEQCNARYAPTTNERGGTPGERARLAFQHGTSVASPLFDSREQPMVGNVGAEGRAGPRTPRQKLAAMARHIKYLEERMYESKTEKERGEWREGLRKSVDAYVELEKKVAAGHGDDE